MAKKIEIKDGNEREVYKVASRVSTDYTLANAVWSLVNELEEHSDIDLVGVYVEKQKEGVRIEFKNYTPGDEDREENLVAAVDTRLSVDDNIDVSDHAMIKAIRFMNFYYALNSRLQTL